jgi:uncharacterized protein YndB with AHSA1/START domain
VIEMAGTGMRRRKALDRELIVRVEVVSDAAPSAVYALLADIGTHLRWAGSEQNQRTRLRSVDVAEAPARVGTEFHTTGTDPMGSFDDHSVVTEAEPGRSFEFVTDAHLVTKERVRIDWTNVHRYELESTAAGCRIVYTITIARISELAGMLRLFRVPGMRSLAIRASERVAKRSTQNLAVMAEQIDKERR